MPQLEKNPPLVSIVCAAYNQERYIAQCLDGLLMQKTDFEYEIIVSDDASTDSTADIIREYASRSNRLTGVYQEHNLWSQGYSILRTVLYPRSRGKYIAICEGDDYWTDPYKLQKQVDYMEAHPDVSVCATEGYILNQATGEMRHLPTLGIDRYNARHFLKRNQVYTLTTLSRADWLKDYQFKLAPHLPRFLMGDYPMWLYMASRGPIVKLSDRCVVYRELVESASHFTCPYKRIDFVLSSLDIKVYFNRLLKIGKPFMVYRKFRDIRHDIKKECMKLVSEDGPSFQTLYFYALRQAIFHSHARPSCQARRALRNILK